MTGMRTILAGCVVALLTLAAAGQTLDIDKTIVTRNDSLKATLKLPAKLAAEGKLALTWTDSYGRTVARHEQPVPAGADSVAITLPLARAAAMLNVLQGEVKAGAEALKVPRTEFIVTPDNAKWDDYQVFMYYAYPKPEQQKALRDMGITCGQIQSGSTQDPNGARDRWWQHGYRFYCDQIIFNFLAEYHSPTKNPKDAELKKAKALYKQLKSEGKPTTEAFIRHPSFNDPKARADAIARMKQAAIAQHRFKPFFYTTDECGVANLVEAWDFDYDPRALDAFRQYLTAQYGSLAGINKEWGTDFKKLENVVPLTTDQTMAAAGDNFSSWADHRHFMNATFAQVLKECGDAVKSVDPDSLQGIIGAQMPAAFGGYDYWLLAQNTDTIEPYNIGNNRELWRSFAPKKPATTTGFGSGDMEVWRLWYQALHGDMGVIIYDEKQSYLEKDSTTPSKIGAGIAPTYKELTGGIGKQLWAMERVDDPVAVHYSHPSITAHWMIENRPKGGSWVDRGSWNERQNTPFMRLREAWLRLPEDSSLGYSFVSYAQLGRGDFDKSGAKVLILPQSIAMSRSECDAVRRFVERGGTAIADARLALMDEHCKMLEKGQLDDLFGIERKDMKYERGESALESAWKKTDPPPYVLGGKLANLRTVEPGVKAVAGAGVLLADAAGVPAMIVRDHGKGRTIYLNMEIMDYHRWRMKPPEGEPLRGLLNMVFAQAGVKPQYAISAATGEHASIVAEVHPFRSGELRIVGLHRNYQFRTNELGPVEYQKNDMLEKPLTVKVGLGAKSAVYDQRAGKLLAKDADSVDVPVDKYQPTMLTILPAPVEALKLEAPASVAPGTLVEAKAALVAPKLGDVHAFRVRVAGPDGKELMMLRQNITAPKGQATFKFAIALSDPVGQYTLSVQDVATGTKAEHKVDVK